MGIYLHTLYVIYGDIVLFFFICVITYPYLFRWRMSAELMVRRCLLTESSSSPFFPYFRIQI
jgi:hypothetical protein